MCVLEKTVLLNPLQSIAGPLAVILMRHLGQQLQDKNYHIFEVIITE